MNTTHLLNVQLKPVKRSPQPVDHTQWQHPITCYELNRMATLKETKRLPSLAPIPTTRGASDRPVSTCEISRVFDVEDSVSGISSTIKSTTFNENDSTISRNNSPTLTIKSHPQPSSFKEPMISISSPTKGLRGSAVSKSPHTSALFQRLINEILDTDGDKVNSGSLKHADDIGLGLRDELSRFKQPPLPFHPLHHAHKTSYLRKPTQPKSHQILPACMSNTKSQPISIPQIMQIMHGKRELPFGLDCDKNSLCQAYPTHMLWREYGSQRDFEDNCLVKSLRRIHASLPFGNKFAEKRIVEANNFQSVVHTPDSTETFHPAHMGNNPSRQATVDVDQDKTLPSFEHMISIPNASINTLPDIEIIRLDKSDDRMNSHADSMCMQGVAAQKSFTQHEQTRSDGMKGAHQCKENKREAISRGETVQRHNKDQKSTKAQRLMQIQESMNINGLMNASMKQMIAEFKKHDMDERVNIVTQVRVDEELSRIIAQQRRIYLLQSISGGI